MNGMATNAQFKRTYPENSEYGPWVKSHKPEVIIGNTSRRANELEERKQGTTGAATNIVHTFISSQAHPLILESTPYLLKSANWMDDLSPLLSTTGCCWEAVELSAQQVGVPSTKRKTFVACVLLRGSTGIGTGNNSRVVDLESPLAVGLQRKFHERAQ